MLPQAWVPSPTSHWLLQLLALMRPRIPALRALRCPPQPGPTELGHATPRRPLPSHPSHDTDMALGSITRATCCFLHSPTHWVCVPSPALHLHQTPAAPGSASPLLSFWAPAPASSPRLPLLPLPCYVPSCTLSRPTHISTHPKHATSPPTCLVSSGSLPGGGGWRPRPPTGSHTAPQHP